MDMKEKIVDEHDEATDSEDEITPNNEMTQDVPQDLVEHSMSDPASQCWGMLCCKSDNKQYHLMHRVKDGFKDRYVLGRHSTCDLSVSDKRISSKHCYIYCDYEESRLRVFLEDSSVNGTFVNDSLTRLHRNERIQLKSGDDIYLINPRYVHNDDGNKQAAFLFINMRERMMAQRAVGIAPPMSGSSKAIVDINQPLVRHIEDDYVIGDEIGKGMSGVVYLCTNRITRKQCAVKIIDTKNFGLTPGLSTHELQEEAQIMKTLNHPNIIRIYDTYETNCVIYIVMELVRGGDLFDSIVVKSKYSEAEARVVMVQLLSAVQYLHTNDIIHRDLKPENILLMSPNHPSNSNSSGADSNNAMIRITDFGLAKRATQEGLKTFCGTPQYFAPEVLKRRSSAAGAGRYGKAADMWSIGVILFILLSGTFPFDEDALFDQIAGAQYSMSGAEWYHISTSAKDLIRKLMKLHPHERLSIKEAMQHPWVNNITSSDFSNSMGSFSDKFISKLGAEKKVSVQSTKNGKNSVRRSSSVARIKSTTLCSSKFSKKASIQGSCNTGASSRMMNEFIKSVRSTATAALNCQSQSDGLSMPPPPPLTRLGTGAAKRKRSVVASTAAVGQGVEYATSFYDYYKPAKKRVIDAVNVDTCVAGDHYSPSKRVAPAKDVDTYVVGDHSPNMSSLGCTKPSIGSMFNSASKCHSVKAIEASLLKSATVQSLVSESLNSPAGSTNSSLGQAVFITPSAVANGSGNQGGQYSGALLSPIQSLSVLKKKKGGKKTPIQNHSSQSTPNSLSQVSNCDPIVLTDTCSPCTAMCKTLGVVDSEALNAQLGAEQGVRETGVNDVEIEVVALNTSTPQGNAVDILPSVPGKSTISRKFTQKTLEGFKPLFTTSKDSNTRVVPVFGSAAFGGKVRSKKSTILDMLQPNPSIPLPHHRGK